MELHGTHVVYKISFMHNTVPFPIMYAKPWASQVAIVPYDGPENGHITSEGIRRVAMAIEIYVTISAKLRRNMIW